MTHRMPATDLEVWLQALQSSDSAWLITDDHFNTVAINDGFTRLTGYTLADMQGHRPLQKLMASGPELDTHILEQLQCHGAFNGELLLKHRDGTVLWVAAMVNNLNRQPVHANEACAQVIVLTDIGFTKRFEALQREVLEDIVHEKPLALLMRNMCCSLEEILPDVHVSILSVQDGALHSLAAPSLPEGVTCLIDGLRIGPDVGSCGKAAYLGHEVVSQDLSSDPNWRLYAAPFLAAGLRACWSCPVKNHDNQVIGTFALYFDTPRVPHALHQQLVKAFLHLTAIAMERDASKQRIRQLAYYDSLTRLPNRTMFNECAQQALHTTRGQQGLLFYLDLDRFKYWNDSMGHGAGDALLCEVAHRLTQCTRAEDIIGRLSSDEFVVFMPCCTEAQIPELARHLLDAIAQPFSINGVMTLPNACIGVCAYPEDGTDIETLLRHADQAMYAAKSQGSQLWERYRPELGQISQERADMERELRLALANGDLQLHFQPQVRHPETPVLYGLESLSRWHHPEWGWVSPARFIAVAEDSGLIHALTAWLLDAACSQLAQWRKQGLPIPHVAVNLSTNNFHAQGFAQQVQFTLHKYGLQSSDLVLEITESVMLDNSPVTLENLKALHAMGLRLSMDDFGTGYSSLSYLHRLPISELKLDKSFVQDVVSSSAASALTRSVLNIATSLNMTVVAEGVETEEQASWLAEQGCPVLQGYLFAKPMAAEAVPVWLDSVALKQSA